MVKKILKKIVILVETVTKLKITLLPQDANLRPTAVKSDIGFWYAGKITDETDISYGIFRNGLVEAQETNLVLNILKQLNTSLSRCNFYDIGANSGYYGIMAAYVGGTKTNTYSFEPLTEYSTLIEESITLNHLEDKIKVFKYALGSAESTGVIQIAGSGSSLTPGFLGEKEVFPTREILIKTLDSVVSEENLPAPDFIKIDVEGFESEVLLGALETIRTKKPILFIEITSRLTTPGRDFTNPRKNEVFDLLQGLGYNGFIVRDSLQTVTSVCDENGVYMYLFLNKRNPLHDKVYRSL